MLNDKGFDLWADVYDLSVKISEEKNEYPFAGYKEVLNYIYTEIKKVKSGKILDIGLGTGILTKKLYDEDYLIHGIDFSQAMIDISREKMPTAKLAKHDISKGLPASYKKEKFDFIISTHAMHHLTDENKISLINNLKSYLTLNGIIIIGDISFVSNSKLNECKENNKNQWDDDEIYFAYENLKDKLNFINISYKSISFCAGVMMMSDIKLNLN